MVSASRSQLAHQWPPLYHRIRVDLRRSIESGARHAGDPLPSEAEIQSSYGVSRITARRAVAELGREGLAETRQGVGTFVTDPSRASINCLTSFTIDALRRGHTPGTKVLDFRIVSGAHPAMERLGLGPDEPLIFLKRLRFLDGEPIFVADAYMPRSLVSGLTSESFPGEGPEQSLLWVLEQRMGVPLGKGEEVTCAIPATDEIAEVFGLAPHAPVVKKTCLLSRQDGVPLVYEEAVWGVEQTSSVIWRRPSPVDATS
jgi:GntR family transcriptional regulator